MAVPPSLVLAGALILRFSVSAAQDIDPCDYWFDRRSGAPERPPDSTSTPVPVKAYIDECLSNIECPASHYCNDTSGGGYGRYDPECGNGFVSCDAKPRKCVPRLGVNKMCRIGTGDCAEGLYCSFDLRGKRTGSVCVPKIPKGSKCVLDATFPCASGLVCLRKTKQCGVLTGGFEGDGCDFDTDCQQQKGFYCKSTSFSGGSASFVGKCTKKRSAGAACPLGTTACAGFCTRGSFCMNRREIGQSCSDVAQCGKHIIREDERTDDVVCNVQSNAGFRQGVCVLESNLLRVPGQKCDPKADLCDARRKLRCEKYDGKFACLQKSDFGESCTAGSPFSFCNAKFDGFSLECRRRLALTKKTPYGADACRRARETVKLGDICNRAEYALCEKGTSCVTGPGIQIDRSTIYRPPSLAYCMKEVPLGADCSKRYSTFCTNGSFCIDRTCQKAAAEPAVPVKYSGIAVDCSAQPCAPGLSCVTRRWGKTCALATVVVGLGKACSNTPTQLISCIKGTVCSRGPKSKELERCWPAGGVGALCAFESACKGNLKCRPDDDNEPLSTNSCYDPSTAALLGTKCDPAKSACAIGEDRFTLAKCLPKGSSFACQVESTLFERCSPEHNIGCSTGLVCSNKRICIPTAEVRT